jgi:DNA primase
MVEPEEGFDLLFKDELQERALVRSLMEFGIKPWDDTRTVADFIFDEMEENGLQEMFDNRQLLKIIDVYKGWYQEGIEPTAKSFLYHEDAQLNVLAVSLMDNSSFEISPNWNEHFDRPIPSREEVYQTEVTSCLNYLKLRKIKRLITENQKDMERNHDSAVLKNLIETHHHLKLLEMDLARKMGTVIMK